MPISNNAASSGGWRSSRAISAPFFGEGTEGRMGRAGCAEPPSQQSIPTALPQDTLLTTFSSRLGGCSGCSVMRIPKSHTVATRSSVASRASRLTLLEPRVLRMGGSLRSSHGCFFFFSCCFCFCLSLGTGPCKAPVWDQCQLRVGAPLSGSR